MKQTLSLLLTLMLLAACGRKQHTLPATSKPEARQAVIYPDYTDITIPPNIAPLNFLLQEEGAEAVVAHFQGSREGEIVAGGEADLKVRIDSTQWRALLQQNRGADIRVTLYARQGDTWHRFQPHTLSVAREEIDPYLSYRLIEPGYELYRQLGLYQRNLTNWEERPIYENNRRYSETENHCVNCHNYQNHNAEKMLLHVRANHAGTLFVRDGKAEKVQIKGDSILTSGVYPSWHPTRNLVALSTNKTGQAFHMQHTEKIEVLDEASDLLLYDVDKNEVSLILNEPTKLETFPCWSPDGNWLYYCVADEPKDEQFPDSLRMMKMLHHYQHLHYDIRRIPYDPRTGRFGPSEPVVTCSERGRSATFPRISPDGRYLLYAEGDYGQFHIWHKSSDLYVKDLHTQEERPLTQANSPDVDSYHIWSSNGRWVVFSTRRMDGSYTRSFIAYFDPQGRDRKAFCLPQEDPEHNLLLLKSYNVPELTRNAVRIPQQALRETIYGGEGKIARFKHP